MSIWISLTKCPDKYTSNFIPLNDDNVITASSNSMFQKSDGIRMYDIIADKWSIYIKYPDDFKVTASSICLNKMENILCILGKDKLFIKIDCKISLFDSSAISIFCGRYPSLLLINGQYHIICGAWNPHHYVWNDNILKSNSIFRFPHLCKGNQSHGLIHIKSQKQLLLFGGLDKSNTYLDTIWSCSYNTECTDKTTMYKWKKLDITLPHKMHSFGYILSDNDRYILIFGGKVKRLQFLNDIYIFDVLKMIITKSTIHCPIKSQFLCFKGYQTNPRKVDLMIFGFIRTYYNIRNVPIDIIEMIKNCNISYYIHLIERGVGTHWKLHFHHIFNESNI